MGAGASKDSSNSKLATRIDEIASNYIVNLTYNDMNKLSDMNHCNKISILTAKIIKNQLSPLEQEEMVKRINPPAAAPTAAAEKTKALAPTAEQAPAQVAAEQAQVEQAPAQVAAEQAPAQVEQAQVEPAQVKPAAVQTGGTNELEDCDKIAKFYVKIAHLYAAIMKTVNPVIIAKDENNKNIKYDLSTKKNMPANEEIAQIQHNNFCTNRINTLLQETDYDNTDVKNKLLTIKPRFCNVNLDAKTKSSRKFYQDKGSDNNNNKSSEQYGGIKLNDDDDEEEEEEDVREKKRERKDINSKGKKINKNIREEEEEEEEEEGMKKKKKKEKKKGEEGEEEEGEEEEEGKKKKKEKKKGEEGEKEEEEEKKKRDKEKKKKEEEKPVKETPLILDSSEVGIPELRLLYLDIYDENDAS